jgi:hypothetical protein
LADCLNPTWHIAIAGIGHYPGNAIPSITTVAECMNECIMDMDCLAVDIDRSSSPLCYLLYSIYDEYANPNVDFYKIADRCPTSEPLIIMYS